MSSEIEELLTQVRDADNPSAEDERRVLGSVRASIAAGVVSSVSVKASALEAVASKSALGGSLSAATTKLGIVAVTGALAVGAGHALLSESVPSDRRVAAERVGPDAAEPAMPRARGTGKVPSESGDSGEIDAIEPRLEPQKETRPGVGLSATAASAAPEPQDGPPSLEAELALLREVQSALRRGAPAEALARLDAHRTRDRQLLAERQAARILALCGLGRVSEARRAGEAFLEQHPRSVQRAAVLKSCGNPRRAGKP